MYVFTTIIITLFRTSYYIISIGNTNKIQTLIMNITIIIIE